MAPVRIVTGMTAGALPRRSAIPLARRMTGGAGDLGVCPTQWKVSPIVIELRRVELDDIRAAAQMLHVTGAALRAGHGGRVPVQAEPIADVGGYVLVAIEAELRLPGTVANIVAQSAVLLELLMRLRQFTRHEQCLGIDGRNAARMEYDDEERSEQQCMSWPTAHALCRS